MKKVSIIFLLVLIIFQAGGFFVLFHLRQNDLKNEMANEICKEDSKTEKLILTNSEYQKCRINEQELLFHGEMFDIKAVVFKGEVVEVIALNDSREESLIESIKDFFDTGKQAPSGITKKITNLTSLEYTRNINKSVYSFTETEIKFIFQSNNPLSFFGEVFSPPPEKPSSPALLPKEKGVGFPSPLGEGSRVRVRVS